MVTTLVPSESARPSVLPTDRLGPTGLALPQLRAKYRTIADWRNALTITVLWLATTGIVEVGVRLDNVWIALVCFVAMGPIHARFAILMHEAAHKLLFTSKRLNDWVGTWLLAYPAMVPISIYRRSHFAHHKEEFGPDEPDLAFYSGYPGRPRDLLRRLARDAVGISGWKNFKVLLLATRSAQGRTVAVPILAVQVVLFAGMWAATGAWWAYPFFWWLSWMTQWRVLNRLRAIAEHGGMQSGRDRRVTTHNVAPALDREALVRALQHGLAPRPPRRHGRPVAPPPRVPRGAAPRGLRDRRDHLPELPRAVARGVLGA